MHHYPERVCLVQVATPQSTYLLDPLALVDLSPLGPALSSPRVLKLLHGADYDVRGLNRDWGLTITNLFDTHIAARFLGLERVGLAALLLDVLGIDIPKDRRIQRADWSKRPLDDRALEYAAADVCYLFDLHDIMTERLQELGRMEWVREECERQCEVRHTPQDLRDTVLALPESRKLDSRHRAVLLALYRLPGAAGEAPGPAAVARAAADGVGRRGRGPRGATGDAHGAKPKARDAVRKGYSGGGEGGAERSAAGAPRADAAAEEQAESVPGPAAGSAEGVAQRRGECAGRRRVAGMAHAQP